MKIRLLFTSILLILIGHVLVFAQSGSAVLTLGAPAEPVNAGDTFTVTIEVANAVGVYGGSIRLTYDPLALEALTTDAGAVTPGDFFGNQPGFTLKNGADVAAGSIEYATTLRQPAEPVTGNGIIGTVQFRALHDGAPQITVAEATLLAPRFEEVNGRRIARAVDQIAVEAQGMTFSAPENVPAPAQVEIVPAAEQSDVQPVAQPDETFQPWAVPNTPGTLLVLEQPASGTTPIMIAGIIFFMAGLLLFTMGIGSYVRLHRQLIWQEQI